MEFDYHRTMKQFDTPQTTYGVEVRWTPVQELVVSMEAYLAGADRRIMDLGEAWVRRVSRQITSELAHRMTREAMLPIELASLMSLQVDAPDNLDAFLAWIAGMSVGDMYERYAALNFGLTMELPNNLDGVRTEALELLRGWNDQYFQSIDPAILEGLAAEADRLARRAEVDTPVDVVEEATGAVFVPSEPVDSVLLIPQYHYRPWNLYGLFGRMQLYRYPADVVPPAPGEPPIGLMRVTRALGDESRLRILRHLAGGTRSFTELVQLMGLSKSTVHHHLVILRAAGLVRLEHHNDKSRLYSLRPDAARSLNERLTAYLAVEE